MFISIIYLKMEEPETIEPEYLDIKKEYEIKIEDNKIKIEMNNNEHKLDEE